ncbi:MAG: tRNA (5-methylaminomethyl-2-thiouridine)(34)-methyltransferase MnmD [Mastigocoleus sp.]
MSKFDDFAPQLTADGSFTFFSHQFNESFHSHYGARQESFCKFVEPTYLALKANRGRLKILDICYGLGYNTAAALETIWSVNPDCHVEIVGLELDQEIPQAAIAHKLLDNWDYKYISILSELAFKQEFISSNCKARLLTGDARNTIKSLVDKNFLADGIFLDSFSPPQCPMLWTVEFIKLVSQCLRGDGLIATYSCAAAVRNAMKLVGLQIGSTPPVGRRSPGTVAAWNCKNDFPLPPLSCKEKEHLQTRAAIPYRDPKLSDSTKNICQRRKQEQIHSQLESTSGWRKRWLRDKNDT